MSASGFFSDLFRKAADLFDSHDEREFLPAALEVVETPASPVGRVFALVIVAFFVCAVAWAFFGKVDIIATAQGRILPAGDIKIIQPLDPGVVSAIHVADGDHVRAGQLLIELDPAPAMADRDRLANDLIQAQLDVARLTALNSAMDGGPLRFVAPAGAPPERLAEAEAAMHAQADQQAAKVADLSQQIAEKSAEADEISAETDKINATMPMLVQKEAIHRDLTARGYGTKLLYLDAQQQLAEARKDLGIQTERLGEVTAARAALVQQRDGARSEYAAGVLTDLRKAQSDENQLTQELIKARVKSAQTELRSPIDGVVEQLAVHTLNGVVTPAQHLMIVVPDSRNLVIDAQLQNRDVGFVHAGQSVKVKVETFNFTRYGLLNGQVTSVSRDVVNTGEQQGDANVAQLQGDQKAPAPTYVARIALAKTTMVIDGGVEPLQPGMNVTAEIKTGNRTIMDYLLSPIARKTEESLHER